MTFATTNFPQGELLFYTSKDGKVKMEIRVECETIWMSQQMMAELFQTSKQNVAKHLKRIFEQGELQEESVVNQWLTTAADGKNYWVKPKLCFIKGKKITIVTYKLDETQEYMKYTNLTPLASVCNCFT